MKATILTLLCLLTTSIALPAQIEKLTDAEVQAAIEKGSNEKPSKVGLSMQQHHMMGPFFSIRVFTPSQWIELQAAEARRQLKPFTQTDVTNDMRAKVLYVNAGPSVPPNLNMRLAAENVAHVVVQDAGKKTIIQPLKELPLVNTWSFGIGNPMTLTGQSTVFSYDAVMNLCGKAEDCKIVVTIIGENHRKDFEIAVKDLVRP